MLEHQPLVIAALAPFLVASSSRSGGGSGDTLLSLLVHLTSAVAPALPVLVGALIGALSAWALQVWIAHREQLAAARVVFLELAQNQLRLALLLETRSLEGGLLTTNLWEAEAHRVGLLLRPEQLVTVAEPYMQIPALRVALQRAQRQPNGEAARRQFYGDSGLQTLMRGLLVDLGEAADVVGRRAWGRRFGQVSQRIRQGPPSASGHAAPAAGCQSSWMAVVILLLWAAAALFKRKRQLH